MVHIASPDAGNPCASRYSVSPDHPPYEPRSRFLGELSGSWYDIGHQIGSGAGDLVRWVSDVWWKAHMDAYGFEDTFRALGLYEEQIAALSPDLIRFMHGVADGAEPELRKSPFSDALSSYHKILNTNVFDAWSWRHPTRLPWKRVSATDSHGCSSFVAIGAGPRPGEMIAAHNRHCPFDPKCYQLVYVGRPEGGNAYWCLTNGGAGCGCQIVNARGVSVILNAGGNQHQEQQGNAFGVPWFLLFLHVAAQANTADQAVEMITRGTPEYRERTGRRSLLRTGTWNFLVSDRNGCVVVEASCDRYAIRRPGDLGEIGNYLVMTNHNTCTHSHDQNNALTRVPMTRYGSEATSEGSARRFWTLMWDIRHNFGRLDVDLARSIMAGHHQHDRGGARVDSLPGEPSLQFAGDVTCPHGGGYPEKWERGTADAKIAVHGTDLSVHWTLGRPCEWEGPWDRVTFA